MLPGELDDGRAAARRPRRGRRRGPDGGRADLEAGPGRAGPDGRRDRDHAGGRPGRPSGCCRGGRRGRRADARARSTTTSTASWPTSRSCCTRRMPAVGEGPREDQRPHRASTRPRAEDEAARLGVSVGELSRVQSDSTAVQSCASSAVPRFRRPITMSTAQRHVQTRLPRSPLRARHSRARPASRVDARVSSARRTAPADWALELVRRPRGRRRRARPPARGRDGGRAGVRAVRAPLAAECVRCLDAGRGDARASTSRSCTPTEPRSDAGRDEVPVLDGDLLDLEPVLRDAVVLATAAQPGVRDDCAGLCADCGARLADLTRRPCARRRSTRGGPRCPASGSH